MTKYFALIITALLLNYRVRAQSVNRGDVILNANIGTPHLFKSFAKIVAKSEAFKVNFDGNIEVSAIKGLNPIAIRAEYGINEVFGIGLNYSFWNIRFDVTDHYNALRQNLGSIFVDSVDVYKLKISSKSFGIRPNFHFPIKSQMHDVYIGLGLGFTSNKLDISFSSTDAGRFTSKFRKELKYGLSLPGGFYFAPSIGYRAYFNPFFGLNFELGYEKGAILQAGLVFKFNPDKAVRDKQKNN